MRVETLKTNRRSETNVIHFNNRLFTAAVDYLNALHLEELKEECIPLKRAYADVAQESPKTENKGYVKVSFLEPDEEQNYTEKTLSAMGEEVQRLLSEGVKLNDITILVQQKQEYTTHCGLLRQKAAPARCIGRSVPLGCLACHLHADRCPALPVQSGREDSESLANHELQFADYR